MAAGCWGNGEGHNDTSRILCWTKMASPERSLPWRRSTGATATGGSRHCCGVQAGQWARIGCSGSGGGRGTVKLSRIRPFCGRILLDQRLRINDLAVAAGGENAAKLLNLTVPKEIRAGIGRFHLVPDDMRQRRLDDFARVIRLLSRPVPERLDPAASARTLWSRYGLELESALCHTGVSKITAGSDPPWNLPFARRKPASPN